MTRGQVVFLDHTADVGFDVVAPSPAALFDASARAMLALLRGEEDPLVADEDGEEGAGSAAPGECRRRAIALDAPEPARLLADWLRELLFLHEIDRLDYEQADFDALDLPETASPLRPCRLAARVRLRTGGHAVREIKAVTYHAIEARPTGEGWTARVIFDV